MLVLLDVVEQRHDARRRHPEEYHGLVGLEGKK